MRNNPEIKNLKTRSMVQEQVQGQFEIEKEVSIENGVVGVIKR